MSDSLKNSNALYFEREFQNLLNYNTDAIHQKQLLCALAELNQIKGNHINAINIFNGVLENKIFNLTTSDSVDILDHLKISYYKLHLYPEIFEANAKINSLIKKGAKFPLWSYNLNSSLYAKLNQYDKAVIALKEELNSLYAAEDRDSLIIPSAYNDLGFYYYKYQNYDSAYVYFKKSLAKAQQSLKLTDPVNYRKLTGIVKGNIAAIYVNKERYKEAIPLLIEDIDASIDSKDNVSSIVNSYNLLSTCYIALKEYDKAEAIFKEIPQYFPKEESILGKIQYLRNKAKYFYVMKQIDSSNYYLDKAFSVKDSVDQRGIDNLLASNELMYSITEEHRILEAHKIDLKNQELKLKNNQKNIVLVLASILLLLLLLSLYNSYKLRKSRKEVEAKNEEILEKNKLIKTALSEKEVLLKEVHHRVKNNLQVISGLLELQNISVGDDNVKVILKEGQNRIQSVALVHKMMYQSENVSKVIMQDSLEELLRILKTTYASPNKEIQTIVRAEGIDFDINIAVPINLIVNEVVCNAFKHAFEGKDNGDIYIELQKNEQEQYVLLIADNGIGLPEDFDVKKLTSIGFDLIIGLAKQLKGEVDIQSDNGTKVIVTFVKN